MGPKGSLSLGLKGQDYVLDTESSERTSEAGPVCCGCAGGSKDQWLGRRVESQSFTLDSGEPGAFKQENKNGKCPLLI